MKIVKEITTVSGMIGKGIIGLTDADYGDDDNDVLTQVYQILVFLLLRNKDGANRGKEELKAIWSLLDKNKALFESRVVDSEEAFTDALYSFIKSFGPLTGMRIAFIKACRNIISTGGRRD